MKSLRNILLLASAFVVMTQSAFAAVPKNYYRTLDGKSGQALKNAVNAIIKNHTVYSYGSLWYYFPSTDCMPDNPKRVWDMYSDYTYYFNDRVGYSTSGMNKEHSVPKSWWSTTGGTTATVNGATVDADAYTDLNHLYPSDGDANSAKLHYPLGTVSKADFNNGVTKVGTPVSGEGGGSASVFEPDDRYKGDFARTYFYMATCYQNYYWRYTWNMSNSTWLTLNDWTIKLLLKWHRQDPVSQKEIDRNEAVYRLQNNRNPYIDNPDLVEYIWGEKAGKTYVVEGGEITGDPELITPTQGTVLDFGEVGLGKSITYVVYVKGDNFTSDLRVQLYKADFKMFSISVQTIDRATAVSAEGYPLTITYTPTEVGKHTANLLIYNGGITGSVGVTLTAECKEAPSLFAVTALPATDISDGGYTATWEATGDEIDGYVVSRLVYDSDGDIALADETETEADETSVRFNDLAEGQTHTYTVQSKRLGYLSPKSNVITVSSSGVNGIEADKPLSLLPIEGGFVVKCSEPLLGVRIFNAGGQLVRELPVLECDDKVELPGGVYVITIAGNRKPFKAVVR
ncbi:MAG: endonuclease [Muribaculaceae bacterium]|nr:endonuclease [Muribaculaceae bacterium]